MTRALATPPLAALLFACLALGEGAGQHEKAVGSSGLVPSERSHRFVQEIHLPYQGLGLNTGQKDINGRPARIKCLTCHDKIVPDASQAMADKLEKFHTGVVLTHGDNTCRSCHNPPLFQDFKLVSGRTVDYANVIALCTQCHGQQRSDYDHGAHGGMAGYWNLDRGPRSRNHCLDCHNPHRPAFPMMEPAPHPRYRFLDDPAARAAARSSHGH